MRPLHFRDLSERLGDACGAAVRLMGQIERLAYAKMPQIAARSLYSPLLIVNILQSAVPVARTFQAFSFQVCAWPGSGSARQRKRLAVEAPGSGGIARPSPKVLRIKEQPTTIGNHHNESLDLRRHHPAFTLLHVLPRSPRRTGWGHD